MSDSDMAPNRVTKARKRDRSRKGKDQAEREEPSLTRSLREGNSKRTGSPRAPGEPTGRGGSLTRRRSLPAYRTTRGQGTEQGRRTWKQTNGQGSTTWQPTPRTGLADTRRQRREVQPGTDQCTPPQWRDQTFFPIEDRQSSTPQG